MRDAAVTVSPGECVYGARGVPYPTYKIGDTYYRKAPVYAYPPDDDTSRAMWSVFFRVLGMPYSESEAERVINAARRGLESNKCVFMEEKAYGLGKTFYYGVPSISRDGPTEEPETIRDRIIPLMDKAVAVELRKTLSEVETARKETARLRSTDQPPARQSGLHRYLLGDEAPESGHDR